MICFFIHDRFNSTALKKDMPPSSHLKSPEFLKPHRIYCYFLKSFLSSALECLQAVTFISVTLLAIWLKENKLQQKYLLHKTHRKWE